ncbi:MAG TPA: transglycosylase domain-containing protein [Longilinea sp.]|nr:transglycosylase domain-containing protein [Longilinea sp.]
MTDNEAIPNEQPLKPEEKITPAETEDTQPVNTNGNAAPELSDQTQPVNPVPDQEPVQSADPGITQPTTPGELERHPTGVPDSTGGWYSELEPLSPNSAETQAILPANPPVMQTDLSPDQQVTQASLHSDQQVTQVNLPADKQPTQTILPPSQQVTRAGSPQGSSNAVLPGPSAHIPQGSTDLPHHVEEVDPDATRVSQTAYANRRTPPSAPPPLYPGQQITGPNRIGQRSAQQPPAPPPVAPVNKPAGRPARKGRPLGCFLRGVIALLFVGIILMVIAGSFLVYQYFSIAASLPSVKDLQQRASQFETTRILDRNGNSIYEILDPNAGRRTYISLEKMSPYIIAATLATEDKEYYNHPGFDLVAIIRAMVLNYTTGENAGGASTITQQLARTLLLPDEKYERTVQRKTREIVLAAEITRQYSKEQILELYLNENFYGNRAYGIEAASETYFNTTADKLSPGQAAFLAGLPQAPAVYDIFTNREQTLNRFKTVLVLMYQASQEKDCIFVSTNVQKVCVDANMLSNAVGEIEGYNFQQTTGSIRFPHWVFYVTDLLEKMFDAQQIYRSGFTVYTTIDPALQEQAEQIIKQQVSSLADRNVSDGALIAIKPNTGEILAMVGSADFNNEAISGQVNMAVSPRQPGSSFKPLTYAAAFEKGWNPATLIWDVPSEFSPSGIDSDPSPKYVPVNYDGRFHGPVSVRTALANSYNIPAVKALQYVGIYDDPATAQKEGLISFAERLGITTLTRSDYGMALTLGGGDVSLLEMTGAFAVFANSGQKVPPIAITKIVDYQGKVVYEYQPPAGEQVIRPEHAYLISSILSDNEARAPMFGTNSVLALPFVAAAKTGTTNDFRDNWTIGYTPDLAVGVWVGNADYTPMQNTTGLTGAAPIWAQFMQFAVPQLTGSTATPFQRPAGIVERVVCEISGSEPSDSCPEQRTEIFAYDQLPPGKEDDLWKRVTVDTWTGLRASAACSDYVDEKIAMNVTDPFARKWLRETDEGRTWASDHGFDDPIFFVPERDCQLSDPRPTMLFAAMKDGDTLTVNPIDIYAVIHTPDDLRRWRLEYGIGEEPAEWKTLLDNQTAQYENPEKIYSWDVTDISAGMVTLRMYMDSTEDTYAERIIHINLQVPTPTATLTPTATVTPTVTSTPRPSSTPTPTETPTLSFPPAGTP